VRPQSHAAPSPLLERFQDVRRQTLALCRTLTPEDGQVQSMPDVSPTKWHLAHTTWFFETFLLHQLDSDDRPFHPEYGYLFNSYYNGIGERHARPDRGLLSRPGWNEVVQYRETVNQRVERALVSGLSAQLESVLQIGLNHEEQHQELLLMDIKHVLSCNPLRPVYRENLQKPDSPAPQQVWTEFDERISAIGHGGEGYSFDNEHPRHRVLVPRHALAHRLVTNGEYLEFMRDGGYQNPELWLSDGWELVERERWHAPLYWEQGDGGWREFTLGGMRPLQTGAPVVHVSFYEADAFARWSDARLPTEQEWESAAAQTEHEAPNDLSADVFHPRPATDAQDFRQMLGDVWEWTRSDYAPYPGFKAAAGALGEYNGKFMSNQYVLRGGSCITPAGHTRISYRNFFYPHSRWMFGGIRLARDLD